MTDSLLAVLVLITLVGSLIAYAGIRRLRPSSGTVKWEGFSPSSSRKRGDFPPKPAWKPTVPVDISKTVQNFAYYTDYKRVFVIFMHGTCILLPDDSENPESDAKKILKKVYYYHGDFKSDLMDDGHFLITYSQPAYSIVFRDEVEHNRDYIERNYLDGIVRAEVLINARGERNKFDDRGKIGLFGRARMFMDAQNPTIAQTWRPQL